jgi:hypothetical protein
MLTELTRQTVESFVTAQKALLDVMAKTDGPAAEAHAAPPRPKRGGRRRAAAAAATA